MRPDQEITADEIDALDPGTTKRSVEVAPGVSLHVLVREPSVPVDGPTGSGPSSGVPAGDLEASSVPFLLVHGLASNARLWDGVARVLADLGHPVAAVDLRGHGRSDAPDDGYDIATVATDLIAVIAALGWQRPIAVGQSWGGNVVIELAAAHPDALAAVAAVDGGIIELADRFATWEECRERLAPPRLEGTPFTTVRRWLTEAHPDWPRTGLVGALANFEIRADGTVAPRLRLDRHLAVLQSLYEHRPSRRFALVDVPTLLLPADTGDAAWTHDKRLAVDAAVARLRHGRAHWFSPAHHDVHAQFPLEVATVLHDFATEASA
jgi:pimeloyl-ACP methyl ester carboxylesterase